MTKRTTEAPKPPLTFVDGPPGRPHFQRTVTVGPLDGEQLPDTPEDERVEVVLAVDSYEQCLKARYCEAKRDTGHEVPRRLHERHLGDRFYLDLRQLPRLLEIGAVKLPEELEVDASHDQKAAELEARRLEIKREREHRTAELREQVRREALDRHAEMRGGDAERAAKAEREADAEISGATS